MLIKRAVSPRLAEAAVFLVLACVLGARLTAVFSYKADPTGGRIYDIYEGYRDNIDVLIVGSSHAGHAMARTMWEERGIAAYTLTNSSQPVDLAYYSLREVLHYQKPRVVMVETAMVPDNDLWSPDTHYEVDTVGNQYFRASLEYVRLAADQIARYHLPGEEGLPLLWRWPILHGRYRELTEDDYRNTAPYVNTDLDPAYSTPEEAVTLEMTERREELSETGAYYLERIISLCADRGISLVLFHSPYPAPEVALAQQNTIVDIAGARGVPFIDFNRLIGTRDFPWQLSEDLCRDLNHSNYSGSLKITRYLADYLITHYDVEDHRGDAAYIRWEQDAAAWRDVSVTRTLAEAENATDYMERLAECQEDYVLLLSLDGYYDANPQIPLTELLRPFGIMDARGGMLEHGNIVWQAPEADAYAYHTTSGGRTLSFVRKQVESAGNDPAWGGGIYVDEKNCRLVDNGLNVVVYDDLTGAIVDAAGIDVFAGDGLVRETD